MASQAVWLLNDSDSSAAVVVEWISSSAEALYVSGAASRLCSAAAGHLKLLKYQTSLEHCSDVLASWSQTCFMRLSNGIHTYLHKLNLSMRYLASHSVCPCSSLLSRCMIWLAGVRLKSNLFYPSSASSVIGKVCKCESWGKASCLIIHFVLKTISITAKLGATACCMLSVISRSLHTVSSETLNWRRRSVLMTQAVHLQKCHQAFVRTSPHEDVQQWFCGYELTWANFTSVHMCTCYKGCEQKEGLCRGWVSE